MNVLKIFHKLSSKNLDEICLLVSHYSLSIWVSLNYSKKTKFRAFGPYRILGRKFISFGESFSFGRGFWLQAISDEARMCRIEFGDNFICSDNVHIAAVGKVMIGSNVLVGSNVLIIDHNHGDTRDIGLRAIPPSERKLVSTGNIVIEDNVWLCDNVTVLGGAHICTGAIVGVGSIVRGRIDPNSTFSRDHG